MYTLRVSPAPPLTKKNCGYVFGQWQDIYVLMDIHI